jgi:aspartate/methionine/tyrosine aminotransferase
MLVPTLQKQQNCLLTQKVARYGHGNSSVELKTAVVSYFNRYFAPASPIKEEDLVVTDGTSSLIENVVWNLADSGDGIMYLTPTYSYYPFTFKARANLNTVGVSLGAEDQFREESAEKVVARFEERYGQATKNGVKVKLVLICNPANPQGRFYSRKTLESIVGFCRRYGLHLVSDEIFAMSCFSAEDNMDGFTSALSLPDEEHRNDIHVIYGASKDFGMGGLRLGFLVTKSMELRNLASKVG